MSLQWTAVATFLYAEVFAVLLLCVPFISPKRWSKFFKSRLVTVITTYGNTAFIVIICILVFLLVDAFREIRKYSLTEKVDLSNNPVAVEHIHMKLFRAQRNEYIAGFALLLCLLTVFHQKLREAGVEVPEVGGKTKGGVEEDKKNLTEEVRKLKDELDATKKALQKSDSDVKAMKKQAENLTVEYDRLLEEHGRLQAKCDAQQDKKSD
ncbi:B-cell receptor-associated protein 31-like [Sinocyclocheilus grahami]|uniref:B-cell receptor-associated protein 31-like n=1 Tax=Sinocyclocheilus grahami TaxID=75366 RepID=UPI0007AC87C9|nr:PREDICTED: B-cell receptor-associated protein 31-like [Sinocyclocheilus grahami]